VPAELRIIFPNWKFLAGIRHCINQSANSIHTRLTGNSVKKSADEFEQQKGISLRSIKLKLKTPVLEIKTENDATGDRSSAPTSSQHSKCE